MASKPMPQSMSSHLPNRSETWIPFPYRSEYYRSSIGATCTKPAQRTLQHGSIDLLASKAAWAYVECPRKSPAFTRQSAKAKSRTYTTTRCFKTSNRVLIVYQASPISARCQQTRILHPFRIKGRKFRPDMTAINMPVEMLGDIRRRIDKFEKVEKVSERSFVSRIYSLPLTCLVRLTKQPESWSSQQYPSALCEQERSEYRTRKRSAILQTTVHISQRSSRLCRSRSASVLLF